jgi:cytochrome P450
MGMSFQFPSAFRADKSGQWLDLGTWLLPNVDKLRTDWAAVGRQWALERIEKEKMKIGDMEGRDIMSTIINAIDPETCEKLGTAEIVTEVFTLITAGADSTSTVIASTFFYLSRNPEAYAKCVREVREMFSSADETRMGTKLGSCHYPRACLDEAMRLAPPASAPLYREAGVGGTKVAGCFIPQGLRVATGTYAIHHNPVYFPKPFSYVPERWTEPPSPYLTDGNPNDIPLVAPEAKVAFNPFSLGERSCVGQNLANLEMMLALARVLCVVDFRVPEDETLRKVGEGGVGKGVGRERRDEEYQLWDIWGSDKVGPFLEFRRRGES